MKKIIGFIILIGIIFGIWFKYSLYVKKIKEGVQGKPESTVEEFLKISEKWSKVLWGEKEREKVMEIRNLIKEMEEVKEDDKEKINKIKEQLASLELQNPSYLFKSENYGLSALSCFMLYKFGGYKIIKTKETENNKAEIGVEFSPVDFMGLGSFMENITGKKQKRATPENIYFHLEKKRYRWYIVNIEGRITRLIDALYKFRKYK